MVEPVGSLLIQHRPSRFVRGRDELHHHAVGDDRGNIARNAENRLLQRPLVVHRGARPVFAHANRLAVGLDENLPVLLRKQTEAQQERHLARQARPHDIARLRRVPMNQELVFL